MGIVADFLAVILCVIGTGFLVTAWIEASRWCAGSVWAAFGWRFPSLFVAGCLLAAAAGCYVAAGMLVRSSFPAGLWWGV